MSLAMTCLAGGASFAGNDKTSAPNFKERLDGCMELGDKANLANILDRCQVSDVQPETMVIDPSVDDTDETSPARVAEMLRSAERSQQAWVIKPALSSEGRGVQAAGNGVHAAQLVISVSERSVVQRYVPQPLLYRGRKCEYRFFALVAVVNRDDPNQLVNASGEPELQVFGFPKNGYGRAASAPWVAGNWSDPLAHVTNAKRQEAAGMWLPEDSRTLLRPALAPPSVDSSQHDRHRRW